MMKPIVLPDKPFTTAQAAALGLSEKGLLAAVKDRRAVRIVRGVYLRADVEQTTIVRAAAAALVMSPFTVLCDRTAAWIHGVDTLHFFELDTIPALEAYVLRGHQSSERPECVGGTRDLCPSDWTWIGGVRVTTPLRTALDLGCKLSRRRALAAMDALMRLHQFTCSDMNRVLPRYFRRRGVIQLRQLVPLVDGRSESSGESWTRLEILDHGLPTPTPQHWISVGGVPTYRLDLAYPHARVVIEYDGEQFHSNVVDRGADQKRRKWLKEHGWTIIVVDKNSFGEEAIRGWIAELSIALRLTR